MPRRDSPDRSDAWWHVTNRGIAKRTVFENGHDVEQFLSLVDAVAQAGWLEIHAFAILTTHFHLLVRTVPWTDLVRSASRRQQRWFAWKARLADGTRVGTMAVPECVLTPFIERLPRGARDDAPLRAGLLRELAALSFEEIARRLGCAMSTARQRVRAHDRRCETDQHYRVTVARIVDVVVRRSVPMPARAVVSSA